MLYSYTPHRLVLVCAAREVLHPWRVENPSSSEFC